MRDMIARNFFSKVASIEKMHGIRRVVTFCLLTMVLPIMLLIVPLYLKHSVFAEIQFAVTESDVVEITDGISPVFCSEHRLKMNETFNAFQVSKRPERTKNRKHIRLKKSMTLPDDTLEYWGFFLLKDARVVLSVCSRLEGASILVVKGERTLRTCGMLDHNQNKAKATNIYIPKADQQVKVTFESNAQEINSQEMTSNKFDEESQQAIHSTNNKLADIKNDFNTVSRQSRKLVENEPSVTKTSVNSVDKDKELNALVNKAEQYLNNHLNPKLKEYSSMDKPRHFKRRAIRLYKMDNKFDRMNSENINGTDSHIQSTTHRIKHQKTLETKRNKHKERIKQLQQELGLNAEQGELEKDNHGKEEGINEINKRYRRSQQPIKPSILDRGYRHGGGPNVANSTDDSSSVSSFENGLLTCYDGNVLLSHKFSPAEECDVNYLLKGNKHMQTEHNVTEDGYYYYIFYSDHDDEKNDIHAIFDIYKPTLQFAKDANKCINKTECVFPLSITSMDRVIVEVPTRDGIDHEIDDISLLRSTCVPRMGIYVIFPIAVLFLVLGCAFM
ncbi:uncharacterized protein LOC131664519 isoform X2 [Phymastichus coffea]|uniref:uncharacterized protein LOC131664519 isoform X2 n=1 Tax=Phymastichus coffea TaxID=108790 RepID=UPI00273B3846|nr:uncharacterized protein LOC131664519 isoform X2 [Phymastichus coffea]